MIIKNQHFPFWILTLSIIIGFILPILIQDGMFMDGMLYTCVAKNLANGYGTFWFPKFSEMGMADNLTFHEHPPLIFGIQAIFFKFLGNSMYVERFYSFFTAIITAALIAGTWKLVTKSNDGINKLAWLPILFWIIIPVCYWSYQNNMHENTMGIFTLLSVYFSLKALQDEGKPHFNIILSGIFIFLASLSKGVPGFFPIGVFGIYWLVNRKFKFKKMLLYTTILIATPLIIYAILLLFPAPYESLYIYLEKRLLGRVEFAPTVDNRFYILEKLFSELLPTIVLSAILMIIFKIFRISMKPNKTHSQNIILFILIGLSGSLPLMLTMVQKGFYFVHSLPFFGLGFALLVAPGLQNLICRMKTNQAPFKIFTAFTILMLVGAIVYSAMQKGKTSRDQAILHDVYLIGEVVPEKAIINIDKNMWNDWSMQCYLIRYFDISVDYNKTEYDFYLSRKSNNSVSREEFEIVTSTMNYYQLYSRKP